ncbi:MAG: glycosyltransferase family 4 protein [Bacilli bacterium]|nr:glycosyltransferase family 4 protein [Bacilli bacterium]
MKKILMICNDSNAVINFRKELIKFLIEKGFEVVLIAGDKKREADIKSLGVAFVCVPYSNRKKSVFASLKLERQFRKIIQKENPDIVFTFQIKPNIFGSFAAAKAKIKNLFCMIEGLGDPFQPKNFKEKILMELVSLLYKKALKKAKKVFVLNSEDRDELVNKKIIDSDKIILIQGIGIDTSIYKPLWNINSKKTVTNLSRLIINKGIIEYCKIARDVRKKRPDITFKLYGVEDQITKDDLLEFIQDNSIEYKGYSDDVISIISEASIIISTSHREGFSRVLLEAMALGRPVIASNVIGNRELVVDGVTGFLCDLDNLQSFSNCIVSTINDDSLLRTLGKNARHICETKYDSSIINQIILDTILNNVKGNSL